MIVKIQVVKATNLNGDSAVVVYTDGSDDVAILEHGMHFEAEAYHLQTWADRNNVVLTRKEVSVEI